MLFENVAAKKVTRRDDRIHKLLLQNNVVEVFDFYFSSHLTSM